MSISNDSKSNFSLFFSILKGKDKNNHWIYGKAHRQVNLCELPLAVGRVSDHPLLEYVVEGKAPLSYPLTDRSFPSFWRL